MQGGLGETKKNKFLKMDKTNKLNKIGIKKCDNCYKYNDELITFKYKQNKRLICKKCLKKDLEQILNEQR